MKKTVCEEQYNYFRDSLIKKNPNFEIGYMVATTPDALWKALENTGPIDKLFILCHGRKSDGMLDICGQFITYMDLFEHAKLRKQPDGFSILPLVHCYAHEDNFNSIDDLIFNRQMKHTVAIATSDLNENSPV